MAAGTGGTRRAAAPWRIAVASGKGGTGKTTVAVNLARAAGECVLRDCDVEAPNVRVFVPGGPLQHRDVEVEVPSVDENSCTLCRLCAEHCAFHALVVFPGKLLVAPEMCHACGLCYDACPAEALHPEKRAVGSVRVDRHNESVIVVDGELNIREPRAEPVISAVLETPVDRAVEIRDCPPGTSCPVVAAARGADFAVLVTEPTPLGAHDLGLAIRLARALGIPAGAVINRNQGEDGEIRGLCAREGVEILGDFPFDRDAAGAIARGGILYDLSPGWRSRFDRLWERIMETAARSVSVS